MWQPQQLMEIASTPVSVSDFGRNALGGCNNGDLLQLTGIGGTWKAQYLDQHGAGQLGISTFDGAILSAREDGTVHWFSPSGKSRDIYLAKSDLTTCAMGQNDPDTAGIEAVIAGSRPELIVLYKGGKINRWTSQTIHRDESGFNHVTVGEVYGRNRGPEIVASAKSGKLYVAGLNSK